MAAASMARPDVTAFLERLHLAHAVMGQQERMVVKVWMEQLELTFFCILKMSNSMVN